MSLVTAVFDPARIERMGVEEEFHVVDLETRELVPRAPELLDQLSDDFTPELQQSVVEANSRVCASLGELRAEIGRLRAEAVAVADRFSLGIIAAGTVPLVDPSVLELTNNARFRQMHADYQLLVREQLICGTQVHVDVADRDLAVAVAARITPWLPVLLALSASSPFWLGLDSGYASSRSLAWQRWPTAGGSGATNAAEHDSIIAELVRSETISDPGMVYFDVRPATKLPTLELRITDSCPDIDGVVLLAGLFRALVRCESDAVTTGSTPQDFAVPLQRAAIWRAARSGLEGDLLDLPRSTRPVPAALAVAGLLEHVRPHLEAAGDWENVSELADRALGRGSSAAQQRRAFARRGRLADVVDLLLANTRGRGLPVVGRAVPGPLIEGYVAEGDEAIDPEGSPFPAYGSIIAALREIGPQGLRARERVRDDEQRSRGVTFGVPGEASTRLFPVDLLPRVIPGEEWSRLCAGLVQRARALDAFLGDVYAERGAVHDGVIPAWVIDASPGLRPTGALMRRQPVRSHVSGMDLVHDGAVWRVLAELVVSGDVVEIVRDGVRRRVDVLYLRIGEESLVHATGADGRPLGPDLLRAVAGGTVALANALGNGVGDDKAVYAYVGALIEYFLGEAPLLADVTTYLCGDPSQLAEVLPRLGELVLKPVDGYGGEGVLIGPHATQEELAATEIQVRTAPHRWIAQEMVQLSTLPTFDGIALVPRHVDLRAFVLNGGTTQVAPVALTRVAPEGSLIVNSSRGGGSKDTWLLAEPRA